MAHVNGHNVADLGELLRLLEQPIDYENCSYHVDMGDGVFIDVDREWIDEAAMAARSFIRALMFRAVEDRSL